MRLTKVFIMLFGFSVLLGQNPSATRAGQQKDTLKKKATKVPREAAPAQGNKSGQPVDVSIPFCDAYLPYEINGKNIAQVFPHADLPNILPTGDEMNKFLNSGETIFSPISKDGSFVDPGYPILGNPDRHLYNDGTDITRLLARLIYSSDSEAAHPPVSLCKAGTASLENKIPNGVKQRPADYYLIHIVRWERSGGSKATSVSKASPGMYVTSHSDWYIFNRKDGKAAHRQLPFTFHPYVTGDLRIFGSKKVLFIAIHLAPEPPSCKSNDPECPTEELDNFRKYVAVSYKMTVSHVEPANIQDLKALIGVISGATTPTTTTAKTEEHKEAKPEENPDLQKYIEFLNATKSRPYVGVFGAATLTNLQDLPVQVTSTMNATLQKVDASLVDDGEYKASGFWDELGKPKGTQVKPGSSGTSPSKNSDGATNKVDTTGSTKGSSSPPTATGCSTTGNYAKSALGDDTEPSAGTAGKCSENVVVLNEGLHMWDVSIGVPFKGVKQLQYNSTSTGTLMPQTVSKASAYGFFVFAPWKEDIVSPPSLGIPHLLVGLPFTGKVFDNPFFGAGETFNLSKTPGIGNTMGKVVPISIRFYCGIDYLKQFGPPGMSSGTTPAPPPPSHRVAKLQFGIEFSVREIANKLTGKSSSNSKSSKTSKSSGS